MGIPSEKKYDMFSHLDTVHDGRTGSEFISGRRPVLRLRIASRGKNPKCLVDHDQLSTYIKC